MTSILGIYVLLVLALYFLQEKFIFLGEPLDDYHQYSMATPFEELHFKMKDGAKINALHLKANDPKGIIYYHHGNAGNLERWSEIAEYFVQFQYDVLIYDYRGYGKSTGRRTEATLHQDAQYIYDWLQETWREDQIIIYGRSLGSGMASELLSANSPKLLILETPFYSLSSMAKYRFPFLPTQLLLNYEMLNWKALRHTTTPIHIFHGTEDRVVPFWSGKKLFQAVGKNASFTPIPGGKHNDLIEFEEYRSGINKILTEN